MLLKNAEVLCADFVLRRADVLVENGKIAVVEPHIDGDGIDLSGKLLLPGLINVHTHGADGCDVMTANYDDINRMSMYMAKTGTTAFMPSTSTMLEPDIKSAMANIAAAMERGVDGACILGAHMEGPYLAAPKRGAHKQEWLRSVNEVDFDGIQQAAKGCVRMVTIAPETDGAMAFIEKNAHEIVISLGHTGADYDMCKKAFEFGANHVTHMFNAMPSIHHRTLTLIAAAFDSCAMVELIGDGLHVDPVTMRMAYNMFGDERILIVTDSLAQTGMGDGVYEFAGTSIVITNGIARQSDGTISGGTSNMWQCVNNLVSWGISMPSAVKMASKNPAVSVGVYDKKGSIGVGKDADLLIADKSLNLLSVMIDGKFITKQ